MESPDLLVGRSPSSQSRSSVQSLGLEFECQGWAHRVRSSGKLSTTCEQLTRQFMCENIVKPRKATAQRKQKLFGTRGQGTRTPGTIDDRHPDGLRRRFFHFFLRAAGDAWRKREFNLEMCPWKTMERQKLSETMIDKNCQKLFLWTAWKDMEGSNIF